MSLQQIDLIINSKENIEYGVSNPVRLALGNIGNKNIVKIIIKSASIVNNFYNIRSGINNKLYVEGTSGGFPSSGVVTITPGQYTITSLLDHINAKPAFINFGATLSFDSATNKIITTVTGSTNFSYLAGPTFLLPNNTAIEGAYNVLGLVKGTDYVFTPGAHLHPNMCDLSGVKNIYVETNFSKMNSLDSKGYRNVAVIIPMDVPYLSVKSYVNQEQLLENIDKEPGSYNLSSPIIEFLDIDRNILDTSGINWEMCFKIYYLESSY